MGAKEMIEILKEEGFDEILRLNNNTLEAVYYCESESAIYLLCKDEHDYKCVYRFYEDRYNINRVNFDKVMSVSTAYRCREITDEIELVWQKGE